MRFCITGPQVTFHSTERQGNRAPFWNTTMRSAPGGALRSGSAMVWPSSVMEPDVSVSKPAMALSSVVLPQPEGPTTAQNSPGAMSRSSPSSATTWLRSGS